VRFQGSTGSEPYADRVERVYDASVDVRSPAQSAESVVCDDTDRPSPDPLNLELEDTT